MSFTVLFTCPTMENLLCNEVWLMSPNFDELVDNAQEIDKHVFSAKEDCEEALRISLSKEAKYTPELGYLMFLKTNHAIRKARLKAVDWLTKSHKRMNLLPGTVFLAVNYVDRFISLTQKCRDWKCWMFELLSVACLSIASKFNETTTWLLQEFQVEGVDNCFAPTLIQRMELKVLKTLGWRMDSTTPFSYVQILTCTIDDALNETIVEDFTKRVTDLLLTALLDAELLEFGQCVVATSAVRCVFDDLFQSSNNCSLAHLDTLIPQDQKDNLVRCQRAMVKLLVQENDRMLASRINYFDRPSSPVTVLKVGSFNFFDGPVHLRSGRKRKREELAFEYI